MNANAKYLIAAAAVAGAVFATLFYADRASPAPAQTQAQSTQSSTREAEYAKLRANLVTAVADYSKALSDPDTVKQIEVVAADREDLYKLQAAYVTLKENNAPTEQLADVAKKYADAVVKTRDDIKVVQKAEAQHEAAVRDIMESIDNDYADLAEQDQTSLKTLMDSLIQQVQPVSMAIELVNPVLYEADFGVQERSHRLEPITQKMIDEEMLKASQGALEAITSQQFFNRNEPGPKPRAN